MDYEIVDLSEKTAAGISARTNNFSPDMGQVIGGLWQKFFSDKMYPLIGNKVNGKALGIYTDYRGDERDDYTAAVMCEVTEGGSLPEGAEIRKIPAGRYARFVVRGNAVTEVRKFWQGLWETDLNRSFVCDFEEYQGLGEENEEIHIYIGLK